MIVPARPAGRPIGERSYRHGDSNPGTDPATVGCWLQRLDPPYPSESIRASARLYANALVLELDGGERLVFDRQELAQALAAREQAA